MSDISWGDGITSSGRHGPASTRSTPIPDFSEPRQVGPYKILEKIGQGGMGAVYLAEQTKPIRRRVAVKIIKLGMDSIAVIARFEAERQALALMDHANIAKVLDAGTTAEGRPYFVMEYVKGEPITEYCDRHLLNTEQRLDLFVQVCQAVQHAHQKAVIHRDIKPSNILVTVADGQAHPKVIDFGVAKAIEHKLTERTLFTEQGQIIGTPEYMSPEQAEMTALNVDTRTDIYSLGVVLYELLVGALPFDSAYLRRAAFGEIQRIIREEEPPKPSTRLSTMEDDDSNAAAQKRHTDHASLRREIRGDLDWITMRAMHKDRTLRYATASELAADVARHLQHDPVHAGPPSVTYRLRKFVRKNRGPVAAVLAVFLALALGLLGTFVQYRKTERARTVAVAAKEAEKQARERAETAAADLGWLLHAAGELDAAERYMREALEGKRRAVGSDHQETLLAMAALGKLLLEMGRFDEAESICRECVDRRRRLSGAGHETWWNAKTLLGGALVGQAQHLIATHPAAALAKLEEAEPLLIEGYEALHPPAYWSELKVPALMRIIVLYDLWETLVPGAGHAAKAAEWRASLLKLLSNAAGPGAEGAPASAVELFADDLLRRDDDGEQ